MDDAHRSRRRSVLRPLTRTRAIVLGALAALVVALVVLFQWNWLRGPVERIVASQTGRSFDIAGDLDVDLGRVTTIRADALRFGNADWSPSPTMASADRAEVDVRLWPLLVGEVRLIAIRLTRPRLRLEFGPDGGGNWIFGERKGESRFRYAGLWIDDGRLVFLDPRRRTHLDIALDSIGSSDASAAPVELEGKGRWAGNAFSVAGRVESPLALRQTDKPYRIDLRATAGPTRAHARGTLLDPFRLRDFDLRLRLAGQDLEDLFPLIGIATPSTPPYRLDGRFTRDGDTWRYDDFTGIVGDSDLGGSAAVTVGRERPLLKADLVSKRLDFDDLAGFVGAPPQTGGEEAATAEQRAEAAALAADARVLPDTPYDLTKLRAMDADVRWKAHRINAPRLPIEDMDAHLLLEAGLLRLEPLNFGVAEGDIRSTIRMDARSEVIRTKADVAVRGLDLGELFPSAQLTQSAIGRIGGNASLAGTGNSVAGILGTADGEVMLGMGRGQVSNLLMELAGLDVAEALKFLLTQDRTVAVRCAFGDFAVEGGVMRTRALAFDTSDTIILGKGEVSLKEEILDLELRPRPKDRSILALRSPLVVDGTFKDPSFRPDFKRLGLRGATALALGSIAPPAALLATIEPGPGQDSACGGQYAK
ncbi:AsmA family protein [Pseudoxanthomonas sp. F37]|uniref:AsmA family protein n=1 Tax=Pseudoxanthomonas TaxID=83618 RepID=UPI001FD59D08|nr:MULTISPECIES: AsmA family protein [Pseudoxanthomonas]UOV04566.1 AsmA family protein [Pseudoxanthomonas mexicana]UOV09574.1 AsmA family protein [Pseudoxanthomonas sp. F37]